MEMRKRGKNWVEKKEKIYFDEKVKEKKIRSKKFVDIPWQTSYPYTCLYLHTG